jgi:hypothetical protein
MVPLPFDAIKPPLVAVVEVRLMITPSVFTRGRETVVDGALDDLEQLILNNIIDEKNEYNKMLRKQGIFMRINR